MGSTTSAIGVEPSDLGGTINAMADLHPKVALAKQAFDAGDYQKAARLLRPMLVAEPDNLALLSNLAAAEAQLGNRVEARRLIERGLRIAPDDPGLLLRLSRTWQREGRLDRAHEPVDRVMRGPHRIEGLARKADLFLFAGRASEAYSLLTEAIAGSGPNRSLTLVLAQACERLGRFDEGLVLAEPLRHDPSLSPPARRMVLYVLGALYDKAGRYDEAFDAYAQGNALRRPGFSSEAFSRSVDRLIERWTSAAISRAPRADCDDDRIVFIVGMPRSGTSLVEQVLSCHPRIHGGGELPAIRLIAGELDLSEIAMFPHVHRIDRLRTARLTRAARRYLGQASRSAGGAGSASRITDKDPINFHHLGLIGLMLPHCRVIHCRRNAMDTCVSCFFQDFPDSIPFASDLGQLGLFYRDYVRLMRHWTSVVDLPILSVEYEQMVADTETQTRRLLEFLGLPFDERCLRFHESRRVVFTASNDQVRRPIYTSSVRRHERYLAHLGPLREALGDLADA